MRKLLLLSLVLVPLIGCSSGESEPKDQGETVSTGPKMSKEQAAQYANILPGNKQSGPK